MSLDRYSVPLAAGLAAAAAAFAVVVLTTDGGDGRPAPASPGPAPVAAGSAAVAEGGALFARMGCGGCHRLAAANSDGLMGPDLDGVLRGHTRRSLTMAILSPPPESGMPLDFGARMDGPELQAIVTFLLAAQQGR